MKTLTIENRKGKLTLNDVVHKDSADKLIEELGKLYGPDAVSAKMTIGEIVCVADDALESVDVEINTPGGSVFEGQRIYNALREMSARGVAITTTANGLAASMGSLILMAGDNRRMTAGSRIMIHEASTVAWGDARTMKRNAELLESISAEIAGIYAERTGGDKDAIRNQMFAETWMTAEDAKANGFIHTIIKDGKEFDTEPKSMSIFARIFPNNEEAVAKLESMLEENETLRAELAESKARIEEVAPLAEVNAQLQQELADVRAELAKAESTAAEQAKAIADLTEQSEITEAKVAAKASEMLASQGHPAPVTLLEEPTAKNKWQEYQELKKSDPVAAHKFWEANEAAIIESAK